MFPLVAKRFSLGIGLVSVLLAASCITAPLESPPAQVAQQTTSVVQQKVKNKVDILFLIDNSNSMDPMIKELRNRFQQFFEVFNELAANGTYADLHVGVVSSDFGAGPNGTSGCAKFGQGGGGKLIALGNAADPSCKPPVGKNWIEFAFKSDGTSTGNLPTDQNLTQTFTCMASLDTKIVPGCGMEHQLEAVYAALHNNIPENQGFLRDEALLTVVFVTNEDDCSAPGTTDLFNAGTQPYGGLRSYRCTNYGVMCGSPSKLMPYGDSGGPLNSCVSAPNPGSDATHDGTGPGKLMDISRYINLFTKPASEGGVKRSPLDVILVGIDGVETPVQSILALANSSPVLTQCSPLDELAGTPCVPQLERSCRNTSNPSFYADPSVRLNTVIRSVKKENQQITSICDTNYSSAMQGLANLIVSKIGSGCVSARIPDLANPDCVVEDVTENIDGTSTVVPMPRCDLAVGSFPCWELKEKVDCTAGSPQGVGITINRNGQPAPDSTDARFFCATLAN